MFYRPIHPPSSYVDFAVDGISSRHRKYPLLYEMHQALTSANVKPSTWTWDDRNNYTTQRNLQNKKVAGVLEIGVEWWVSQEACEPNRG